MRKKQLEKIIVGIIPEAKIKFTEFENHDRADLLLPDGGFISIGIDPAVKRPKISEFLYFNTRNSSIRIPEQDSHNGKLNYFGENAESYLKELLNELKELLNELKLKI